MVCWKAGWETLKVMLDCGKDTRKPKSTCSRLPNCFLGCFQRAIATCSAIGLAYIHMNEPPLKWQKTHAPSMQVLSEYSFKCSKARITVLPRQVVPSTPCLSWSLFGPSFCYCSAPWYSHWCNLHRTPPSFTPHLLTWKPPVWSLRTTAYNTVHQNPQALRNLHLDVGTRHTQAHRRLSTEAGDGWHSKGETKSPVKESMRIPLGNWSVYRKLFLPWPPRADRPACGTLSCDQRRDVVSHSEPRVFWQSFYCT